MPVPEAEHALRAWRATYTEDGRSGMWSHVTLLYPFLEPEEIEANLDSLRTHFSGVEPFSFALRAVGRFPPRVLFLAPEPEERFRALASGVWALYPDRPPYDGAFEDVVPHCTVVDVEEPGVLDAAEVALRHHLPLSALALEAWLVELVAEGWSLRARLPFAG